MKRIEIKGKKFGRLTVLKLVQNSKWGKARWLCDCDCGRKTIALGTELKSGHTTSCGCFRHDKPKQLHRTHGLSKTRLHRIWVGMRVRCLNPRNHAYKYYGGAGVKICKRWNKFENFIADLGKNYVVHCEKFGEKCTTLDRKNPYGNYTPKNCRWATYREQRLNQRV